MDKAVLGWNSLISLCFNERPTCLKTDDSFWHLQYLIQSSRPLGDDVELGFISALLNTVEQPQGGSF